MSEELQTKQTLADLFAGAQETIEEAQARKAAETISFTRFKNFVMDKFKTYRIRILPLSPKDTRGGYEQPVHQLWLKIVNPDTGKTIHQKVCRATDAGYSVDLIDTYKQLALKAVRGDKELEDKIKGGSFVGGLRYDYCHAMYVFDVDNMEEGMLVWEASNAHFKKIEDLKEPLWKKCIEREKNPKHPCPISAYNQGYIVEIQKKKEGKVDYVFSIDTFSGTMAMDEAQLQKLFDAPLLTDVVKRYTRYHLGATVEFLKQYDEMIGLDLMSHEEMKNAVEILKGELPADDTSSFSFGKGEGDSNESEGEKVTYDYLSALYDDITGKGLTDKTEEGQELRGMIVEYIDKYKLSVKVERKRTNMMLLDDIQEEIDSMGGDPALNKAASTSVNKRVNEETAEASAENSQPEENDEHPNQDDTAEPAAPRLRRNRKV